MTRKRYVIWFILMVLIGAAVGSVLSDTDDQGVANDPTTNPSANACYADGTMAGKCDTTWEWTCGWYLIRHEVGMYSRAAVPSYCSSLLVPLPPGEMEEGEEQDDEDDIDIGFPGFPGGPGGGPDASDFSITALSCNQFDFLGTLKWEVTFTWENLPPDTDYLWITQSNTAVLNLAPPAEVIVTDVQSDPQDVTMTAQAFAPFPVAEDTDTITCQTPG